MSVRRIILNPGQAADLREAVAGLEVEGIMLPDQFDADLARREQSGGVPSSTSETNWIFRENPNPISETPAIGDTIEFRGANIEIGQDFIVGAEVVSVDGQQILAKCLGVRNLEGKWSDGTQNLTLGLGEPTNGQQLVVNRTQVLRIPARKANSRPTAILE